MVRGDARKRAEILSVDLDRELHNIGVLADAARNALADEHEGDVRRDVERIAKLANLAHDLVRAW